MQNTSEKSTNEAKIIALTKNQGPIPQIPEQPLSQGTLQLYTLEYIDQLLDEHFK